MHYKLNWGICFVIFWMNWRQEKIFWYFLTFKVVQETPLLHLQFNLKFYCRVLLTCYSYSAQSKTVWWVIAKLINIILLRAVRVRERGHMPPPPQFLADQFTLYQQGGQVMPTKLLHAPFGFSDLLTALNLAITIERWTFWGGQ